MRRRAAILRGEPDWTALPADVPLAIRTLLMGCLTKDRRHRVRLAVEIQDSRQDRDIWVLDFQRGTWDRITSDPSFDFEPAWTPDGQHLIFSSSRTGWIALFRQAANRTGTAERVSDLSRQNSAMPAMSPDGRYVVVRGPGGEKGDLMILDLDSARAGGLSTSGVGPPRTLIQTAFEEYNAAFSPNGRWLVAVWLARLHWVPRREFSSGQLRTLFRSEASCSRTRDPHG